MLSKLIFLTVFGFIATAVAAFSYCAYKNLNKESRASVVFAQLPGAPTDSVQLTHLFCSVPVLIEHERDVVSGRFQIRNHLSRPIKLTKIRKSCSCADAHLDREHLEPGETATLHLTVRIVGKSGKNRIGCFVEEAEGHSWHCELEATIYSEARFSPAPLHFGSVKPGNSYERELSLEFASRNGDDSGDVELISHTAAVTILSRDEKIEQRPDGIFLKTIQAKVGLKVPDQSGLGTGLLSAQCERNGVVTKRVEVTCAWSASE